MLSSIFSSRFTVLAWTTVYYRVYMGHEAMQLKNSVYQDDQTLGRIVATSVPPPHTVKSLTHFVTRVEGITNVTKCDLFLDLMSQEPIDEGPLSILGNDGPGSTPERAMAFVYSVKIVPTPVIPPPPKRVLSPVPQGRTSPQLVRSPTPLVRSSAVHAEFHKRVIAIQDCGMYFVPPQISYIRLKFTTRRRSESCMHTDNSSMNPHFLSFKRGDILNVASKSRWETFSGNGGGGWMASLLR
jgi:hypothetical protein